MMDIGEALLFRDHELVAKLGANWIRIGLEEVDGKTDVCFRPFLRTFLAATRLVSS
jgi:hypothetical protein